MATQIPLLSIFHHLSSQSRLEMSIGLLLGGLIGHFATKPTTVGSSSSANHNPPPSPSQPNQHNPDAQQTTKHRQLLFDWMSNVELETTLRYLIICNFLIISTNLVLCRIVVDR